MSSDEEPVIELETQFVPQSDDSEQLYSVIEIVSERRGQYKVKWDGVDPATNKPWPDSWVAKHDVTDDLAIAWKKKKIDVQKKKAAKRKGRPSAANSKASTSRASVASKVSADSTSTIRRSAPTPLARTQRDTRSGSGSTRNAKRKRSPSPPSPHSSSSNLPPLKDLATSGPPRGKRRKTNSDATTADAKVDRSSYETQRRPASRKIETLTFEENSEEDSEEEEQVAQSVLVPANHPPSRSMSSKGKEREKASPASSHSSGGLDSIGHATLRTRMKIGPPVGVKRSIPASNRKSTSSTSPSGKSLSNSAVKAPPFKATSKKTPDPPPPPAASSQEQGPSADSSPRNSNPVPINSGPSQDSASYQSISHVPALSQTAISRLDRFDGDVALTDSDLSKADLILVVRDDLERPTVTRQSSSAQRSTVNSHLSGRATRSDRKPLTSNVYLAEPLAVPSPPRASNAFPAQDERLKVNIDTSDDRSRPRTNNSKSNPKLAPLPVITPEQFRPYLRASTSNAAPTTKRDLSLQDLRRKTELNYPMSSIEEFSSPEKSNSQQTRPSGKLAMGPAQHGSHRGRDGVDQELPTGMHEMVTVTAASGSGTVKEDKSNIAPGAQDIEDPSVDTTVDDIVDYSLSGAGQFHGNPDPRIALRQEEEESTQDLLGNYKNAEDLEVERNLAAYIDPNAYEADPDEELDPNSMQAVQGTHPESKSLPGEQLDYFDVVPNHSSQNSVKGDLGSTRSLIDRRSELKSRSASAQHSAPGETQELPPTASTRGNSPQSQPLATDDNLSDGLEPSRLGAALTLLNLKSTEISNLEEALATEKREKEALVADLKVLQDKLAVVAEESRQKVADILQSEKHSKDALVASSKTMQDTFITAVEESRQKLSDTQHQLDEARVEWAQKEAAWQARESTWATERETWGNERVGLVAAVDAANEATASANTDAEFFRKHYAEASEFVSSVREDCAKLEKEAKIARSQATEGVTLVRKTFEERNKMLEAEVNRWRGIALLLQEKDKRTGDEIRRRAALEPELRARCKDLEQEVEMSNEEISMLKSSLSDGVTKMTALQAEKKHWDAERALWKAEMTRIASKLTHTRGPSPDNENVISSAINDSGTDNEDVYFFCGIKLPSQNQCADQFSTPGELLHHMYTEEGHSMKHSAEIVIPR